MKTISKLIFSVVSVLAAVGISAVCYAAEVEEIALQCCAGGCPTKFESPGIPGVLQTVTFKGIKIGAESEVITMFRGAPGYDEWFNGLRSIPNKDEVRRLLKRSQEAARADASVLVKCSGSSDWKIISAPGTSVVCGVGNAVELEQDRPTCEDPQTGPHTVIEITKQTPEEHIAKEQQGLYDLLDEREQLNKQLQENNELIAQYREQIARNREQIARNREQIQQFKGLSIAFKQIQQHQDQIKQNETQIAILEQNILRCEQKIKGLAR